MKKQNNQKNDQQRPSEEIKELTLQEQINYHELDLISENYCSVEDILFEQQHNLHDFSFEAVDFDTKFRSMNTLDNYSMSNATLSTGLSEPIYTKFQTSLPSSSNKQSIVEVIPSNSNEYETLDVPNKPAILGVSQFLCTLSLIDLINKLQQKLNSIIEISYVFHADTCRWEGVYLRGSSRCKFELFLYKDSSNGYIIEGNRLSGDSVPYRNIFLEVQSALCSSSTNSSGSSSPSRTFINPGFSTSPQALPCTDELQPDEAREALKSILSMAKSNHLESKIEAAKILCDLSYQQDLHHLLCETNCVEILIEFMQIDHEYCNQHAICALANLSSSRTCQSSMMRCCNSLVPLLLTLVADGPYHTAEMRRECARALANLCTSHGPKIVHTVGTPYASDWLNTVEELKDERLKLHANRAKNHLMTCF